MVECEVCEREFKSKKGKNRHRNITHDLDPIDVFWFGIEKDRVDNLKEIEDDRCWEWQDYTDGSNYGHFTLDKTTYQATRFIMRYLHGDEVDDMFVCHHCDNPPCVNPNHLYIGTQQDNVDDRMERNGDCCRGFNNVISNLTKEEAQALFFMYDNGIATLQQLMDLFDISRNVMLAIRSDNRYENLKLPDDYTEENCRVYINQLDEKPALHCEVCGQAFHNETQKFWHISKVHDLSLRQRFFIQAKFDSLDDCWEWPKSKSKFYLDYYNQKYNVQQVALNIKTGIDFDDINSVKTNCRDRQCINPSHVRHVERTRNSNSKYTVSQMRFAKWLAIKANNTDTFTRNDVAKFIGMANSTLDGLYHEERWSNLTVPDDYEPPSVRGLDDFLKNGWGPSSYDCEHCDRSFNRKCELGTHKKHNH